MPFALTVARRRGWASLPLRISLAALLLIPLLPGPIARGAGQPPAHLVVSEIVTGGASASDELIEIHNPTSAPLPLEGLEVVYASASGATVSRRAAWELGAPSVPAGGHVLIANQDGLFAPIADATYASGIAAAGGSVAIRIIGASTPIDAAGWGSAAGTLVEGTPAPAPAASGSIERLPGGAAGSTQDTDDNAADFIPRDAPEPQNLGSPPTPADPGGPSGTPLPSPTPSALPTPTPPSAPSPTPGAEPSITIAEARALPDGAIATIEGVALTASDFHDGGGYVVDATGGIAVLLTDGAFPRGSRLQVTGELDDRFSQRTVRAASGDVIVVGDGSDASPVGSTTGGVDESSEGVLVAIAGTIVGSATELTTGRAYDLDDGSGAVRVLVGTATGIDTAAWTSGTAIAVVGVVGQRDSTGSGTVGYRVMPRDAADITGVTPPSSATPTPSPVGSPSPSASPGMPAGVSSIATARSASKNTSLTVRGVVTLASGVVDKQTAVIQDATGAIVLRLGGAVGSLPLGAELEVTGARSTKSGMETLRVTEPPRRLGSGALPAPVTMQTGDAGEAYEARLVTVRGSLAKAARRAASGSVSFDLDDGSGALKVVIGAGLAADATTLAAGTWVEVRGVLGQETTGAEPSSGYRLWPATEADVRVVASSTAGGGDPDASANPASAGGTATEDLAGLGEAGLDGLRVGATLVAGPWSELGIGGVLWDGSRVVAIDARSGELVTGLLGGRLPPVAVELGGLRTVGIEPVTGVPLVALDPAPGQSMLGSGPAATPRSGFAATAGWASLVGGLAERGADRIALPGGGSVRVEFRCDDERAQASGVLSLTGIALGEPRRLVVPCAGILPAPVLARHAPAGGDAERGQRPPATAAAASPTDAESLRPIVGGLLLAAALALAGGGAVVRWRRRPDGDDPVTAAEPTQDAEAPDAEPAVPRLTLVSVPREHGP